MTKIVKIEELKFIYSERLDEFHWNFDKNLTLYHVKSDWKQSFTLSSDSIFFEVNL